MKNIALVIGSFLLTLALPELALRAAGWAPSPPQYEGTRHYNQVGGHISCPDPRLLRPYHREGAFPGCVFYAVDIHGLRDERRVGPEKKPGWRRILALGDSFTYGFGVRQEDTFLRILEAEIPRLEILNAARTGTGLADYERRLNELAKFPADLYLVGLNLNDLLDFPEASATIPERREFTLRRWSRLVDFFAYRFERKTKAAENLRTVLASFKPERETRLRSFLERAKAATKGRLVVVVFPIFYDFQDYAFGHVHHRIGEILAAEKVSYVDLLPAFAGKNAEQFWILENDQHPNELAHKIFARELRPWLSKLLPTRADE